MEQPSKSLFAVIMAGGVGTRFWPHSRQAKPKQFLDVFGSGTMIQATLGRLAGLVAPENCIVVTNEQYKTLTQLQLPVLPMENILGEPMSRNTAPCIAWAAAELYKKDPNATMIVLPADHLIANVRRFQQVLRTAITQAQEPGSLVTIGIEPTHPEIGYGYIQFHTETYEADEDGLVACPVKAFAEKPDIETAERFLATGEFLWNSGMFVWRADTILSEIQKHMPDLAEAFQPIRDTQSVSNEMVFQAFKSSPKISVDYGIMEPAEKVFVVPGNFGWNDVGDWRAVYDLNDKDQHGNALRGKVVCEDATRNLVFAGDKLVAVVGMHDTIVVNTPDALLVCHKEATQKVKNVVEFLNSNGLEAHT
ncbi:MAG TPA: mannose-1-phosphate guanylyltransferase [Bacteroidetes bacterium]|nr:mannose-1-phosphate guanylyltransferase [Bacteroidota bacterium]HRR07532.1 mannose-1-phosphate guanylyltransferase [Rhodothermales bacterium]